jgi:PAS domain S-box-containing protein
MSTVDGNSPSLEARLRFAQQAGRIALWEWDVGTGAIWCSAMLYELLGLPPRDGIESDAFFFDRVHPADREWLMPHLIETIAGNGTYDAEFRIARADGEERWLVGRGECVTDDAGRTTRMLGVNFDITDRKRIEQQLIDLNVTLEARVVEEATERERLWALSQDMIVQCGADGTILRANLAARRLLQGQTSLIEIGIDADARRRAAEAFEQARTSGAAVDLLLTMILEGGERQQICWSVSPDPSDDGFVAIGRDMTDMLNAQQMLREAEQRLIQMQQIESLGQLASGVAHDFNNLLVPILGVLDMLNRRPQGDSDFDELIKGATHAALSARAMVRRMLSFAQQRQGKAEPVDAGALVSGMRELIAHLLPPSIIFDVDCSADLPLILIDANQLELAIMNLALNGRDAMPDGGTLKISAGAVDSSVVIDITDTGTGMDDDICNRATEAFYTTKVEGKGTGLGLFMAARLAERYHGDLTIDSAVGLGTTIRLRFPVAAAAN